MRTFLIIVGLFNLPAIFALLMCISETSLFSHQMQKTAKVLLKVGIAKAVGGVLLALYISLKFAYILPENGASSKAAMKLCVVRLGESALVDVIYSFLAFIIIKKTKQIARIVRKKRSTTSTNAYVMTPEKLNSESSSNSGSCSEEEMPNKGSHNSI